MNSYFKTTKSNSDQIQKLFINPKGKLNAAYFHICYNRVVYSATCWQHILNRVYKKIIFHLRFWLEVGHICFLCSQ